MITLVTGASGFLGSALVRALLTHTDDRIRCMVRSDAGVARIEELSTEYGKDRILICRGDLTRKDDAAMAVVDADVVYHAAAAMKGSPADMFRDTLVGSNKLLEAVSSKSLKRIVLISSFGVYGVSELEPGALITEETPLEKHPEMRDPYSHTKLRQEQLFWEYKEKHNIPLVVVRPGVIYGPGGPPMSSRVGINVFGIFLHLGRSNLLPLTYVSNCAEAIVAAATYDASEGEIYNIVDDELPTSGQFLRGYRRQVRRVKYVTLPFFVTRWLSAGVERYNRHSRGQLPAILTPYKARCNWKSTVFDNSKIKSTGWRPNVSTEEGLRRFFSYLKQEI